MCPRTGVAIDAMNSVVPGGRPAPSKLKRMFKGAEKSGDELTGKRSEELMVHAQAMKWAILEIPLFITTRLPPAAADPRRIKGKVTRTGPETRPQTQAGTGGRGSADLFWRFLWRLRYFVRIHVSVFSRALRGFRACYACLLGIVSAAICFVETHKGSDTSVLTPQEIFSSI